MNPGTVGTAIGLFAVTNIDGILVLALFFARALSRWGHVPLPPALVTIGLTSLVEGGAFGL
ncbi:hypothetical protein [Parafrankia discariae]|uniref:hypothetical protein n=1 Tax=Parafrankia discariae TaxID=365528 RepID=UPI00035F341B|nr:hypothetical protein [Parafrankia discariae]